MPHAVLVTSYPEFFRSLLSPSLTPSPCLTLLPPHSPSSLLSIGWPTANADHGCSYINQNSLTHEASSREGAQIYIASSLATPRSLIITFFFCFPFIIGIEALFSFYLSIFFFSSCFSFFTLHLVVLLRQRVKHTAKVVTFGSLGASSVSPLTIGNYLRGFTLPL